MLLELDESSLQGLLHNREGMAKAVAQAKHEYLRTYHPAALPSKQDDLGHAIYHFVHHTYPQQAAKITGKYCVEQPLIMEWEGSVANSSATREK